MYTVQKARPLNPVVLSILQTLHEIAQTHQASYFLIGATARDILMTHVFGIDTGRATRDVDFAIALEDWPHFEVIRQAFISSGQFQARTAEAHRLYYQAAEHGNAYPLDLIPFGKIAGARNSISWPPDMAIVMNVTGYSEALDNIIQVNVGAGLIVNVVSIPSLAVLKVFAWNDRGLQDNKDAQDLLFLLRNYHAAGNASRLYNDASSLMESCGFDIDLAGAALLGVDTSLILDASTTQAVLAILDDPARLDRLTVHMSRSSNLDSRIPASFVDQFKRGLRLSSL